MKRILSILVLFCPLAQAQSHSYSTNFPATENPISQGSVWLNGAVNGTSWGNCQTTPGLAYGTIVNGAPPYNDSTCVLKGTWSGNQMAQGIVNINATDSSSQEEVELRLNVSVSPGSITGYEADASILSGNLYLVWARWNGPLNSYCYIHNGTCDSSPTEANVQVHNGDVLTATNINGQLNFYLNGVLEVSAFDTTYRGGSPGMGFWNVGGTTGDLAHYGFSQFTAWDDVSVPSADVLAPYRGALNWPQAGSPAVAASTSWLQCGATVAAGSSAATINAALAACTANHYVQLAAGTYNLTTGLTYGQNNNIKMVGAGANQTFLVFTGTNGCLGFEAGVCMASADLNYSISQSNTGTVNSGYTVGSTQLSLTQLTGSHVPTVGQDIVIDQLDDTVDSGDIYVCFIGTASPPCSTNGDNGGFARTSPGNRSQQQIVTVTSVSGSGPYTIGFSPAIIMPNWSSSKTPQAWWANVPVYNMGIENLSLDMTNSGETGGVGFTIEAFNCAGCWAKGIRSIQPGRSHFQAQNSSNITVQDSYFYRTVSQTSSSYGVESAGSSNSLFQNNIFQQVTEPMSINGNCSGCVEGYNFDIDDIYDSGGGVYTWRMASSLPHAVGNDHILVEGNQGSGYEGDIIHGSHHFNTLFRNAYSSYQQNNGNNPTGNISANIHNALNRFDNVIGNALGSSTLPSNAYSACASGAIYSIGCSESGPYTVPADTNVLRTMMRWGNWDVVTNAVRWCGNSSNPGWSTTCASTSEVPSTITNYPNPVPSNTTLPASFYLPTKPSWWPSTKPWPPIGPDVTGGNLAGFSGFANTIPAADCYTNIMGGSANGTGAVLSFNAAGCYGNTPTPTSPTITGQVTVTGQTSP